MKSYLLFISLCLFLSASTEASPANKIEISRAVEISNEIRLISSALATSYNFNFSLMSLADDVESGRSYTEPQLTQKFCFAIAMDFGLQKNLNLPNLELGPYPIRGLPGNVSAQMNSLYQQFVYVRRQVNQYFPACGTQSLKVSEAKIKEYLTNTKKAYDSILSLSELLVKSLEPYCVGQN